MKQNLSQEHRWESIASIIRALTHSESVLQGFVVEFVVFSFGNVRHGGISLKPQCISMVLNITIVTNQPANWLVWYSSLESVFACEAVSRHAASASLEWLMIFLSQNSYVPLHPAQLVCSQNLLPSGQICFAYFY